MWIIYKKYQIPIWKFWKYNDNTVYGSAVDKNCIRFYSAIIVIILFSFGFLWNLCKERQLNLNRGWIQFSNKICYYIMQAI